MIKEITIDNHLILLCIEDLGEVLEVLWSLGCTQAFSVYKNVLNLKYDLGFSYSRGSTSVIFLGKQSSEILLINTIAHEARHILQYIADLKGYDLHSELVCYLLGALVSEIYFICKLENLFVNYS